MTLESSGRDRSFRDWVTGLRRWFHRHPEPSFEERATQAKVEEVLDELGIGHRRIAGTGVIATIEGRAGGPVLALRADMDALRIPEEPAGREPDCISENPGVMHACGHDGHMAMLLGAGRLLQERRGELPGSVRLIFQPAEETLPGGAARVIDEGGLHGVDAIVCLHLFGRAPAGELRYRAGRFMAHTCDFDLTIRGRGGHHMCPQDCIDPMLIGARFVASVQTDLATGLAPDRVYVLGFGTFASGTQYNQTPETAHLSGSFRCFDEADAAAIERVMRTSLDGLVRQHTRPGAAPGYELTVKHGYPVLVNDEAFSRRAAAVLGQRFRVSGGMDLNLGAEDFARYLERVPGMFLFLGCLNPAKGITEINHSARFDIDEAALVTGVDAYLALAQDYLAGPDRYRGPE